MKILSILLFILLYCPRSWALDWHQTQNDEELTLSMDDLEYSEGMLATCQLEIKCDEHDIGHYTLPQLEFEGFNSISTDIDFKDQHSLTGIYNLEVTSGNIHALKAQVIKFSSNTSNWTIPEQVIRFVSYNLKKPQELEKIPEKNYLAYLNIVILLTALALLFFIRRKWLRKID